MHGHVNLTWTDLLQLRRHWEQDDPGWLWEDVHLLCPKAPSISDSRRIHSSSIKRSTLGFPWPLASRGIDVIGPIELVVSDDHQFILVTIDYFIKWVEASTHKTVTKKVVADFVCNNSLSFWHLWDRNRQCQEPQQKLTLYQKNVSWTSTATSWETHVEDSKLLIATPQLTNHTWMEQPGQQRKTFFL